MRGKDGLDGQGKEFCYLERELEAGAVFSPFKKADGLIVHADGVGKLLPADTTLGAEHCDAVEQATVGGRANFRGTHIGNQLLCIHNILSSLRTLSGEELGQTMSDRCAAAEKVEGGGDSVRFRASRPDLFVLQFSWG